MVVSFERLRCTETALRALRRYLRIMTEAAALVTFPASFGIALVAPECVHLVLGVIWEGAIIPLHLLGVYSLLRSLRVLLGPLLTAVGEARLMMNNALLSL
jgi:lipopolysaccharide exporter